jgi:hypothetical protein
MFALFWGLETLQKASLHLTYLFTYSDSKPPISFPFYLDVSFAHHHFAKGCIISMTWTTVTAIKSASVSKSLWTRPSYSTKMLWILLPHKLSELSASIQNRDWNNALCCNKKRHIAIKTVRENPWQYMLMYIPINSLEHLISLCERSFQIGLIWGMGLQHKSSPLLEKKKVVVFRIQ